MDKVNINKGYFYNISTVEWNGIFDKLPTNSMDRKLQKIFN
jgi:hypothetical protein